VLEVMSVMIISLRNLVLFFGFMFLILVISVPSFDVLYFMFVYVGGLMMINFLMVTGDVGSTMTPLLLLVGCLESS